MSHLTDRRAFTLLELLVVVSISAILMALGLAAVQRVRDAAARAKCANNLRQIGLALVNYHDTHQSFPPGVRARDDAFPFMSWHTRLLPFIERSSLWEEAQQAFAKDRNFLHRPPHDARSSILPVFVCPADGRTQGPSRVRGFGFTSYLGVEGTNQYSHDGLLFLNSAVRLLGVSDGASNTLLLGERPPSADGVFGWWYAGWGQNQDGSADMVLGVRELNVYYQYRHCQRGPFRFQAGAVFDQCAMFHFWSTHLNGSHFLFADGSVHFLSYMADSILPQLATRAGGEEVEVP